jgi:hypothetical protein
MMLDPSAATWMSDAQRKLLLALLGGALATGLVAWLMPPSGIGYWVVLALGGVAGIALGWLLGGTAPGRRLDRLLLGRFGTPAPAWVPSHPDAMEPPAREALERAVVPVLLGLLHGASRQGPTEAEALLATARNIMRQPEPPAREVGLLVTWLPRILEAVERKRRDVAGACALLQAALRGQEDADMAARLEALLAVPLQRKGRRA